LRPFVPQNKFKELLPAQRLREVVWSIRRAGIQPPRGSDSSAWVGGFALDRLVADKEDKSSDSPDNGAMGKEADVYPALARVARVVLRERELDARASVELLLPEAGRPPSEDSARYDEAVQQQAEFLQRLCLAVTFARQTGDQTATAAVEAVRATDEVLQKSRRALRFVGGAATGRGEQSDGEDDDGAAPRPAEKDELGDEPDPLLDLKQLPPLRCEMAPSVIHILGAIFDSDSTVVAKRRLSRSDDSSMRVCVAPFLLLRFEMLEEGAVRPDVHDGTSESGSENRCRQHHRSDAMGS